MKSKETKLHEAAVRYADCLRKEVSPEPENGSTFRAWDRLKRAARDYSNALSKAKRDDRNGRLKALGYE